MGYMKHHAIVMVAGDHHKQPDVAAFRESLPARWRPLVIGPIGSVINDYHLYAFLPDGSKEGWTDSDDGDIYRERFRALFAFRHAGGSSPFAGVQISLSEDFRQDSFERFPDNGERADKEDDQ